MLCTRCREKAAVYSSIWCRLNLLVISLKASETAVPNANRNPNMLQGLRVNSECHSPHPSILSSPGMHPTELDHHLHITFYITAVIAFQENAGWVYQKIKSHLFKPFWFYFNFKRPRRFFIFIKNKKLNHSFLIGSIQNGNFVVAYHFWLLSCGMKRYP